MSKRIIKTKTLKVYKSKKLNNANFGNYSLNDYQVLLHFISKIGGVDEAGKYIQSEHLQREYTLTAKEFSDVFEIAIEGTYQVLQKSTDKLARTIITIEEFGELDLFKLWKIPVCQFAIYNKTEGSLTIKFNESIMPYLMQVRQKFVLYNLKEIANFGSLYTTRLYELIQEFKDTGYLYKTIEQLRQVFAVGNRYSLYADFKRKTFAHAVKEINYQFELDLSFDEIRNGRKVIAVVFHFKPTTKHKAFNPNTGNMCNIYNNPKRKYHATPQQQELLYIDPLIMQNHTTQQNANSQQENPKSKSISTKDKKIIKRMNAILHANPSIDLKDALSQARSEFDE